MTSANALEPWIFDPVPRAAWARAFDACVLLFSEKHTLRRTVVATHRRRSFSSGGVGGLTEGRGAGARALTPGGVGTHRSDRVPTPGCHGESRGAPHPPPPWGYFSVQTGKLLY